MNTMLRGVKRDDDVPVIHKVREADGSVSEFIRLADYEALSDAAVELCERMSALNMVSFPHVDANGISVIELVRETKIKPEFAETVRAMKRPSE
jgi:hypothetical protein